MISVTIFINGNPIITRSGTRIKTGKVNNIYSIDDGSTIKHRGGVGVVKLAVKMLNTVKDIEVKK